MSDDYLEEEIAEQFTYGEKMLSSLSIMIAMYSDYMPSTVHEKLEKLMILELKGLKTSIDAKNIMEKIKLKQNILALEALEKKHRVRTKGRSHVKTLNFPNKRGNDNEDNND